jgi:hypothetical protein
MGWRGPPEVPLKKIQKVEGRPVPNNQLKVCFWDRVGRLWGASLFPVLMLAHRAALCKVSATPSALGSGNWAFHEGCCAIWGGVCCTCCASQAGGAAPCAWLASLGQDVPSLPNSGKPCFPAMACCCGSCSRERPPTVASTGWLWPMGLQSTNLPCPSRPPALSPSPSSWKVFV